MEDTFSLNKFLAYMIFLLSLTGCTTLERELHWQDTKDVIKNSYKLQTGDIIVKNKLWNEPISWVGHSAVMISDGKIGDYPKIGVNYYEIGVNSWLSEDRKVVVLRYKNFDEKFKKKFIENAKKYSDGRYLVTLNKNSTDNFYCSKYVWFLYKKTAEDIGYNLDIDSDGGLMVFPYDFLNSKNLYQVYMQ